MTVEKRWVIYTATLCGPGFPRIDDAVPLYDSEQEAQECMVSGWLDFFEMAHSKLVNGEVADLDAALDEIRGLCEEERVAEVDHDRMAERFTLFGIVYTMQGERA